MTIIAKTKFLEFKSAKSPSGKDWYYVRRTNDTSSHDSAVVITTLVKKDGEYINLFNDQKIIIKNGKLPLLKDPIIERTYTQTVLDVIKEDMGSSNIL